MPVSTSKLNNFYNSVRSAADWFKKIAPKHVTLIHHNDTDGLTAGTICAKMLERGAIRTSRYCLEKPYPQALTRIFDALNQNQMVLLTDLASGMLTKISEINQRKLNVLVLDHHRCDNFRADWLQIVNTTLHDLDGTFEGSASAVAFQFAMQLSQLNSDLKPLALLGAYGDAQFTSQHDAKGLNQIHLIDPLKISDYSFAEIKLGLDVLGSFAYFRAGPDIAVKILSDGISEQNWCAAQIEVKNFETQKRKFLDTCVLHENENLSYFTLDAFPDSGVKMVGLMCEELLRGGNIPDSNYLIGFQALKDQIPGLGSVGLNGFKVSMRVGTALWKLIEEDKAADVATVLSKATNAVGGFIDGCHRHAGAVTIAEDQKDGFLECVLEAIKYT